ncbi:MAG: aconitate hydratase AcnA [Anaerolineaceae bacterium]
MDTDFIFLKSTLHFHDQTFQFYSLPHLQDQGFGNIEKLPYCLRILLEGMLRNCGKKGFTREHVLTFLKKEPKEHNTILFLPNRIILQDFTGIPVLNDLAALRAATAKKGIDPQSINPVIRTDLIVDHSLQVDYAGCARAQELNEELEFERNRERYEFLRWSEQAFQNLHIIPPGNGIIHQINLEYLAEVVSICQINGNSTLVPDCVLGTDSHTTMINGLGVIGWGVGGIEALGAMLGYPIEFNIPKVVGLRLTGHLPEHCTPTDLTLTITSRLREYGVVEKFVEVFGEGVQSLRLEDRAMISNMTPESGATITYFPVDEQTLEYLRLTGRTSEAVALVETYFKTQNLFRTPASAELGYDEIVEIDLNTIEPVLAGPKRPFDLIPISKMHEVFSTSLTAPSGHHGFGMADKDRKQSYTLEMNSQKYELAHGAVILAAITSCTNTSNPQALLGAGLLAKKAVEKGLSINPYIKTSFTPGSRGVDTYLTKSGLLPYLSELGFQVSGHACATCIGNSGALSDAITNITQQGLLGTAVISGNRNFEGRIHKSIKACYLASPMLVIAYAIAGTVNIDLTTTPIGFNTQGEPIFLVNIMPTSAEIQEYLQYIDGKTFNQVYDKGLSGSNRWKDLKFKLGALFEWDAKSSYLLEPPFILDFFNTHTDIRKARALACFGDSITTDHISPAGKINATSDTGKYLQALGCDPADLNTYGSRRGNHEAMARGTFSNPKLRNKLIPEKDGGLTVFLPAGQAMTIFEAAGHYKEKNVPIILIAGKQYGTGSSRDWAAKGPFLLGVRAVLAESYERIHRSNLVMMGILPLQFMQGEQAARFGITGTETFSILGIENLYQPDQTLTIQMIDNNSHLSEFQVIARLDTPMEVLYFHNGGILPTIFADLCSKNFNSL